MLAGTLGLQDLRALVTPRRNRRELALVCAGLRVRPQFAWVCEMQAVAERAAALVLADLVLSLGITRLIG